MVFVLASGGIRGGTFSLAFYRVIIDDAAAVVSFSGILLTTLHGHVVLTFEVNR